MFAILKILSYSVILGKKTILLIFPYFIVYQTLFIYPFGFLDLLAYFSFIKMYPFALDLLPLEHGYDGLLFLCDFNLDAFTSQAN